METWNPVAGYETLYEVSDKGRIRSHRKKQILKPATHGKPGYQRVCLVNDCGAKSNKYVHRVVASAFLGPCSHQQQAQHINGDASDNREENLRWGSQLENEADKNRHKKVASGLRNGRAKFTDKQIARVRAAQSGQLKSLICELGMSESYAHAVRAWLWRKDS